MYKCWITCIEFYTLMSYRTVGMLHDTWYCKQGHGRYSCLCGQMQTYLTWTTRKIHILWQDQMESLGCIATLQDSLMLALGGFVPLLFLDFLWNFILHPDQCSKTTCMDILAKDQQASHDMANL